jgi:tetratricopeptide (TPR) repeat protein
MLEYRLDDLHWGEFEKLCQALLKAELGVGIEAWGGSGDWGNDAYCQAPLRYPGSDLQQGPFQFQVKFVEGANAAGAKPRAPLVAAVKKECQRIKKRNRPTPRVYSLLTNVPLSLDLRRAVEDILREALPGCVVVVHGGHDICSWLHKHPAVVRMFPQLLSHRDLTEVVRQAIHGTSDNAATLQWWRRLSNRTTLQARDRLPNRTILLIAMLVVMTSGSWWMLGSKVPAVSSEPEPRFLPGTSLRSKVPLHRPSVAVMTFENRSGKGELDWLSTALAEAVSAKLGVGGAIRAMDRHEVSLAETDLLLFEEPRVQVSPRNLTSIRGLLGVDFVLGGVYRTGGTSPIRLDLTLYDARNGRPVAQAEGEEKEDFNWFDLAYHSTELLIDSSHRKELNRPPPSPSQKESLRALFPADPSAARLYFQGLERYRRFDVLGASDFFSKSVSLEPHPLVLAALADAHTSLGRSQQAMEAIQMAKRLAEQAEGTPRALGERYWREIEIIERKAASDKAGVADSTQVVFREFFSDDLSYGLHAAQALVEAGSAASAKPLLVELRLLPLAENHPGVEFLEADALLVQQRYSSARDIALRSLEKAQALRAIRWEAQARLQLASILSHMGYRSEAAAQLQKASEGFEKTKDREGEAQCLEQKALLYEVSDPGLAERSYRDAILLYEGLGYQEEKGRVLYSLSTVLMPMGRQEEAEKLTHEAATLASLTEMGMEPHQEAAELQYKGDLKQARKKSEEATLLFRAKGKPDDEAAVLANIGEIELMRGDLKSAEVYYNQALETHEVIGSEVVPFDLVGLGRVYMVRGEYDAARFRYNRAFHWLKSRDRGSEAGDITLQDHPTWAEVLLAMAELELLTGNAEKSEELVRDVLARMGKQLDPVRSRALSLRARRLLSERKIQPAWETVNDALKLSSGDFRAVREARIAETQAWAARGEVSLALKELDRIAAECEPEQVVYELESNLAAGEIELVQGGRSRRRLEDLQDRAEALHFGQIVHRAASALKKAENASR